MKPQFQLTSSKKTQILFTHEINDKLQLRVVVASSEELTFSSDPDFAEVQQKIHVYEGQIVKGQEQSKRIFQKFISILKINAHLKNSEKWEFGVEGKVFVINQGSFSRGIALVQSPLNKVYQRADLHNLLKIDLQPILKITFLQKKQPQEPALPQPKQPQSLPQPKQSQQTTKQSQIHEDAQLAKIESHKYIKSDTFGLDGFDITDEKITKNNKEAHKNKQRFVFGKTSLEYQSEFVIQVEKITKQERDPVIWVGFVDGNQKDCQRMEQRMKNVVALSDQKKFYINGKYDVRDNVQDDQPWLPLQPKQFQYLSHQIKSGDTIKVQANKNTGQITWLNAEGVVLGSCTNSKLQDPNIDWVPFVELWKSGDSIVWRK